jgi:hypothetical protein
MSPFLDSPTSQLYALVDEPRNHLICIARMTSDTASFFNDLDMLKKRGLYWLSIHHTPPDVRSICLSPSLLRDRYQVKSISDGNGIVSSL